MSLLNPKIEDYGDSVTLEDIGYPSSMLYDNSIVSTCQRQSRVTPVEIKICISNGWGCCQGCD
jgi:hypothetical protein